MLSYSSGGGCVIKIHLRDGTSKGKIEAKLDNWVGEILRGDRSDLEWLLNHKRAQKPGVYLLQGDDPNLIDEVKKRVYIGLSDRELENRLRAHAKNEKMDFWETACLITASDDTMNPNNCSYIEAMLIKQAYDANRANIENKQSPSSPKISSIERQPADNFIRNLMLILPMININFLNPLQSRTKEIEQFMFEIFHKDSQTFARANEINGDFFVLEGSQAAIKGRKKSMHRAKRQLLIDRGDLKERKDGKEGYFFTKDVLFSSPSAAASIVIDGQASGWREWKIKGTDRKKEYRDWRENPSKFKFSQHRESAPAPLANGAKYH